MTQHNENHSCRDNDTKELQKKNETKDKWEIKSDDVTVFEELGHGAFGKVFKGILTASSCKTHGSSAQKPAKNKAKSSITVAVKMLQGVVESGVRDMFHYVTCSYI